MTAVRDAGARRADAGAADAPIDFTVVADNAGLAALEADWRALEARAAEGIQFYQSFGWVAAWWRTLGRPGGWRLAVLAGRSDGRLVLVWPLAVAPGRLCRTLTTAGGILTPYSDAIVEAHPARAPWLAAAWAALERRPGWDVLALPDVRADAAIAGLAARRMGAPVRTDAAIHVDCAAAGGFDAFIAGLSKKTRQNQRRTRKFLAERGAIGFMLDDGGDAVGAALHRAVAFKQDWIKERGLAHAALEGGAATGFLVAAAEEGRADGRTVVSTLTLDGATVAVGLSFLFKGRLNYYLGAFDPALAELGPGRLQMEETLRWCFAHGVAVYDMMPPDTAFKAIWSDARTATASYATGRGWRGWLFGEVYPRRVRPRLKRLYNALPRDLHRLAGRMIRR